MLEQVIIDWGLLERLCGDQPEFMRHLIQLYVEDAEKDRAELRAASDTSEFREVERVAHRMRGAAKTMGAQRIALGCLRLHTAASASDATTVKSEVAELERQLEALFATLDARSRTLHGNP